MLMARAVMQARDNPLGDQPGRADPAVFDKLTR